MVKSTRMDLAFQLAESQARAHDEAATVQDLLDFNKMVSDAKTDEVSMTFKTIDLSEAVIVAIGDSSFAKRGQEQDGEPSRLDSVAGRQHREPVPPRRSIKSERTHMALPQNQESGSEHADG